MAIPVWKQVLTSIVSWQTALVVGITLLSVYGKDIVNWVQGLLGADQAQKRLNDSMTDFNAILATERQHLRTLFSALEKTTAGTEGHRKAINEINTTYGKYLPNLLSEKSSLNEIREAYRLVNRQLMENAALKAQSGAIDKTLEKAIKTQSEALTEMREITTKKLGESKSGGDHGYHPRSDGGFPGRGQNMGRGMARGVRQDPERARWEEARRLLLRGAGGLREERV